MNKSYFKDLGIIGWDRLELIILGAMLAKKPILLKGEHGSNKTEGCRAISTAVFGESAKFVPYDTSLVDSDTLLGFLNPNKLKDGEISYISSPDSIWGATSCLLDEINRCNPYNASKFFEIVRSRTINGRETGLKFVWAACNPPDKYNTMHMDAAQVSRFLVLEVPTFAVLSAANKKIIIKGAQRSPFNKEIQDKLAICQQEKVFPAQSKRIKNIVIKIANALNKTKEINFSGRQARDLTDIFLNMDKVVSVFKGIAVDEYILCTAVMGIVPEATGLIRNSAEAHKIEAEIAGILMGFKLSDPVMSSNSLEDLCSVSIKDKSAYFSAIIDMLKEENNNDNVKNSWKVLKERKDISKDIMQTFRQEFAAKCVMLKIDKKAKLSEACALLKKELKSLK